MSMFGWDSKDPSNSSRTRTSESPQTAPDQSTDEPKDASRSPPSDSKVDTRHIDPELLKLELEGKEHSARPKETSFPSSVDSDKKGDTSSASEPYPRSGLDNSTEKSSTPPMPHRIEPYMNSSHRSHRQHPYERRQSPPPITSIHHSPSPSVASLDRSTSVSTPPIRRTPPHPQMQAGPVYTQYQPTHYGPRGEPIHTYMYSAQPQFDQRYPPNDGSDHSPYHPSSGMPNMNVASVSQNRDAYGQPYPLPGQANMQIVHTDDAATKLSDRVRRRCFNCCTTDTSTWRRSNLSPGKVLCNKCGLFERTHSRPRPEQFPHKRGPLASSTLGSRTSPTVTQLPPISPPYHPSIAPLNNNVQDNTRREYQQSNTLPGIPTWHESGQMQAPTARRNTLEPNPHGRAPSPPPPARSQQPTPHPQESREPAAARESAT